MIKAIFTSSPGSHYKDLPEIQYHFPKTYLRQVEAAVGDWIIYYEPRRDKGLPALVYGICGKTALISGW